MKKIIIISAAFLLLIGIVIGLWYAWRGALSERDIALSNVRALQQDTSEMTAEITVSAKEFQKTFSKQADSLKGMGYSIKRLKEYHALKLGFRIDTVLKSVHDTVFQVIPGAKEINSYQWGFSEGCLNAEFFFADTSDMARVIIGGEIHVDIVTAVTRPRGWFWKLKWNPKKWPVETRVTSPCNIILKENIKFEIK